MVRPSDAEDASVLIPCLSLWQPWSTLLVGGAKKIETRSWPFRGQLPCVLAIHAAKKWNADLADLAIGFPFRSALEQCGVVFTADEPSCRGGWNLPFGAVIGLVRLVECVATAALMGDDLGVPCLARKCLATYPEERAFGDFRPGRYAWTCDRFHVLAEPVPCVGRQGVFRWPATPEAVDVAKEWQV